MMNLLNDMCGHLTSCNCIELHFIKFDMWAGTSHPWSFWMVHVILSVYSIFCPDYTFDTFWSSLPQRYLNSLGIFGSQSSEKMKDILLDLLQAYQYVSNNFFVFFLFTFYSVVLACHHMRFICCRLSVVAWYCWETKAWFQLLPSLSFSLVCFVAKTNFWGRPCTATLSTTSKMWMRNTKMPSLTL